MQITVIFTTGHISIKRGRVTRQYVPTMCSFKRLCHTLNYGPCEDGQSTQRSSIHYWRGVSSLDDTQLLLFKAYAAAYRKWDCSLDKENDKQELAFYYRMDGIREACKIAGIHTLLVESVTPCIHGNLPSKCYTCATSM